MEWEGDRDNEGRDNTHRVERQRPEKATNTDKHAQSLKETKMETAIQRLIQEDRDEERHRERHIVLTDRVRDQHRETDTLRHRDREKRHKAEND